jgi:hypothetical protein
MSAPRNGINGVSVIADAAPYPLSVMTTFFGPVVRVSGFARILIPERELQVGPRAGTKFKPSLPNHVMGRRYAMSLAYG